MNIMLVCYAGMSTSMLVKKMQEAADAREFDAFVWAVGTNDGENELENKEIDCVLLGPQARYALNKLEPICKKKNIKIEVMSSELYGSFDGEKVLDFALEVIKKEN